MIARIAIALLCFTATTVMAQTPTWTTGTYVYDGSGNIESIGGRPFIYDELGRLTYGKVDATHGETYGYDGFGNIVTIQKDGQTIVTLGAVPSTNRMTDQNAHAWADYNPDGSIAWTMNGDTFEYDGLGMVKESEVASTRRFYLYSPSDERIASVRIQGNNTAGNREWTIRNPSGAVLTRFTQTPSNAWSWDEDYAYANGQLLAANVSAPEKVRHFFPDHLGTPRVITGNGGAELSRHTYYAFGEEVTSTASTERLKFTGHERDHSTLDYMHARYYAPMWGRFLSVDPHLDIEKIVQNPQMWNRYAYASNNAVNRVDPDGKSWLVFNRKESTLTLYDKNGTVVGTWSATNKPDSSSKIDKLSGKYEFYDRKTPHKHGNEKVNLKDNGKAVLDEKGKQVQVPKDSPKGPYGSNGIFRLNPYKDSQGPHAGVGVHDGKVGVRDGAGNTGWEAFTNGCVRTTPEAMETIVETVPDDPLEYLEAKDQ
jgi:RHS repeat-associated protein